MIRKHLVVFLLNLAIWININILQVNAFSVSVNEELDPCGSILSLDGSESLNNTFGDVIISANKFDPEQCSNNEYYQVSLEEGKYKMEPHNESKYSIIESYYEPNQYYFGVQLNELRKNMEIIGKVNENNEPITSFECPGPGYMGFIDVIHANRKVYFKNIVFSGCSSHIFKIFHFTSFDNSTMQPEYKFENCIFENNYDESIFFYEYLAGDRLANNVSTKYDGKHATSTKNMLVIILNNNIFRNNHVWNREKCGYNIVGERGDCYYFESEVKKLNEEINRKNAEAQIRDDMTVCVPSESEHGVSTIMITTPMYYICHRNFGNCYSQLNPTLFVTNNVFENNTGGERGLFDLRCLGAEFSNNTYTNNWGIDSGLIYMFDTKVNIQNEQIRNQHSYWGYSNALYQLSYSDLTIRDSNYEDIESQTSSIANIQSISANVYIYNTNFTNVIFPFEISSKSAELHCVNCIIKDIQRDLSKNKPIIAQNSGDSTMFFNYTEIYNIKTSPLFKAIESSNFYFNSAYIHDVDVMENIGLMNLLTSSSAYFNNSKIYDIIFKRVLDNAYFINFSSTSCLTFKNTEIRDINIDGDLIYIESSDENSNSLYIDGSSFKKFNITSGSIIKISTNKCKFQIKNSNFSENTRSCNDEDDIERCSGVILIDTDLGESTIDGCIFQDNIAGIGPAITILDIKNVELNLQNSKFIGNNANYQGGALYITGEDYLQNSSNSLKMRNLEFRENHSNSGGAIFIKFPGYKEETIEASKFIDNVADNGGGVFYFPTNYKNNQPKLDESCIVEGNKALFGNYSSSDPYKIVFKGNNDSKISTYSGKSVESLTFELQDEYGNIVSTNFDDGTFSLQNMVFVKAVVINKNKNTSDQSTTSNESSEDVEIIGESFGYFQNGTCSFSMQFYSEKVDMYELKIYVALSAYESDNLYYRFDLNITDCPKGMLLEDSSNSRYQGCVPAICDGECIHGTCGKIKGEDKNGCECDKGFIGEYCENRDRYVLSKAISIYNMVIAIAGIVIAIVMFIFILIKKEKIIVKMSSVLHLALITVGCIMGFASIIFDFGYPTKFSCIIRELLINLGSLLIYTVLYFKIYSFIINNVPENISFSASASMKSNVPGESRNAAESSMKVSKFDMSMDVKSGFNFTSTINNGNDLIKQTNQNKKEIEGIANNLFRKQYMEGLKKSFHRIFGFILVLFAVCFIINVTLFIAKGLKDSQMSNDLWAETCESLEFSPVPYAVLLLLLIILFTNVKKLWSLSTMFAEAKHICYSIGVWLTLGPLIQLICESMMKQNPNVRLAMMAQSVFLSFFIIDFLLIGLKVIAIIRGGGDTCTYTNSKLTQFYNEPSSPYNNNQGETTNSFRQ